MDSGGACHVVRRHQTVCVNEDPLNSGLIDSFKARFRPGTPGYCRWGVMMIAAAK